jgi:hypothetical protein
MVSEKKSGLMNPVALTAHHIPTFKIHQLRLKQVSPLNIISVGEGTYHSLAQHEVTTAQSPVLEVANKLLSCITAIGRRCLLLLFFLPRMESVARNL